MVGHATQIGDHPSEEEEITHEIEFAIEASRQVIERCFELAGLLLDVDAAGISLLHEDRIWHLHSQSEAVTCEPLDEAVLGFRIATAGEQVASFFDTDPDDELLKGIASSVGGLKFFAGTPLRTSRGQLLGSLWIGQSNNRLLSEEDRRQLTHLAGILTVELQCHLEVEPNAPATVDSCGETMTICSWSKRIRIDGQWIAFEEFLQRRLGVRVTHGIAEDHLAELSQKLDHLALLGRL